MTPRGECRTESVRPKTHGGSELKLIHLVEQNYSTGENHVLWGYHVMMVRMGKGWGIPEFSKGEGAHVPPRPSWGSILPSIVEMRDQNIPLLFSITGSELKPNLQIPCDFLVWLEISSVRIFKIATSSYAKLTSKIRKFHGKCCKNILYLGIRKFTTWANKMFKFPVQEKLEKAFPTLFRKPFGCKQPSGIEP